MQTKQQKQRNWVHQKDINRDEEFYVDVEMRNGYDHMTYEGKDRQAWKTYIEIPQGLDSKRAMCYLDKDNICFDNTLVGKEWDIIRKRNIWRKMNYWNRQTYKGVIDQKQFLLDTKLMIEDKYSTSSKHPVYTIDKKMLSYITQFRSEIFEYWPNLYDLIMNIEYAIYLYNEW